MNSTMCLCPCCHKYEFSEVGSYEICPVCNWEDNPIQGEDPTYGYGG
ncbi:CPCC family cysteine-rich protein [Serratia sp. NPDC071084]